MLILNLNSSFLFLFRFLIFFLSFLSLFLPSFADVDSRKTAPPHDFQMTTSNFSAPLQPPPAPPPPLAGYSNAASPFNPSIAVIVGVLTTAFSIILLLLLYVKHCKRGNGVVYNGFNGDPTARGPGTSTGRKNSGIDRTIIESLPIFRFSSLRGQKDGLECAVCLTRFNSPEVLRLLPKCKHAFHVECVDTWLDAHSTCPLCRYRVDPEDILLIDQDSATTNLLHGNHLTPSTPPQDPVVLDVETGRVETETDTETTESDGYRRISGRHSSAGEKATASLSQIVVQRPAGGSERVPSRSYALGAASFARRSLDSFGFRRKNNESVTVGCFDRYPSHQRKDGLLLLSNGEGDSDNRGSRRSAAMAGSDKTRFEHRIIVSGSGFHQYRWSDVHPSDLLYLRSEMIISDLISRPSVGRREKEGDGGDGGGDIDGGGERSNSNDRSVINSRSVSEITGLSRFSSRESNNNRHRRERQAGVVSRWLAWISSQSQPELRSNRTSIGAVS